MSTDVHAMHTFMAFEDTAIEQSLATRFEQQVARYPDRLAVVTGVGQYTYTELNQVANRLARVILAQVGESAAPVALLCAHGACTIAAILGILKAGKIYVALEPEFPQARTVAMLEDAQATLLLTNTQHLTQAQQLAQAGQHIVNCDTVDTTIATDNLDQPLSPDTGALILYTSGSTGRPKGVLHNQRNILVEARNYTNDIQLCPEDRLSLCHSCSFANSIRNLYGALLNGATLCLYDLAHEGLAPLAEWMRTKQITIFHTLGRDCRPQQISGPRLLAATGADPGRLPP